jgi:hypothetical protein
MDAAPQRIPCGSIRVCALFDDHAPYGPSRSGSFVLGPQTGFPGSRLSPVLAGSRCASIGSMDVGGPARIRT